MSKKAYSVTLDTALCKACGYCEESCKKSVFVQRDDFNAQGYHPYEAKNQENCIGCQVCMHVCPEFAIIIAEK